MQGTQDELRAMRSNITAMQVRPRCQYIYMQYSQGHRDNAWRSRSDFASISRKPETRNPKRVSPETCVEALNCNRFSLNCNRFFLAVFAGALRQRASTPISNRALCDVIKRSVAALDRLRVGCLNGTFGISLGGVPREQKILTGHLPRVIYHQVY